MKTLRVGIIQIKLDNCLRENSIMHVKIILILINVDNVIWYTKT